MAKFKKALALVLALAMVITLAPLTSVTSKAAAKYKISAKTTAIAAGKTYNVMVTGVQKGQYVKVSRTAGLTVKYNKKTIKASKKVAGTGKALTFKVTAPGKEKAYNATIKVTIYNKNNKKVKTLSTKRKIKAAPVEELALSKVESGTNNANGANIVIAYFNRAVDTISPSDIQIRRVSDDQLFSVDKVVMASDKKSATITLTGTDAAGAGGTTRWLMPNVDYKMTVTSGTSVAEKVFFIPAVAADALVIGVNPAKKTFTAQTNTAAGGWNAAASYNIPDSVKVDYNELLGQTVTFKYDKTNTISTISYLDGEQVIYGAFKEVVASATDWYVQDQLTETKYYPQTAASGAIPATRDQNYAAIAAPAAYAAAAWGAAGTYATYAYGKLTLNTNGTIKNFIHLATWSGNIYVGSVNGNSIISKTKQEQSLENYAILKNGKSIAISDIKEGDVVFFNNTAKIAEVYNNVATGKIQAVYDNAGFKFDGKDRDGSAASYISNGTLASVTTKYLKALGTEKDVTVIYSRDGKPVYVLGEEGVATTSSKDLVLTAAGDGFAQTTSNFIRFVGFNGKANETVDIDISKIESYTTSGDVTFKASNGKFFAHNAYVAGTAVAATAGVDWSSKTTGEYLYFQGVDSTGVAKMDGSNGASDVAPLNLSALGVGQIVTLTSNDKGVVTEIKVKNGTALTPGAGGSTFGGADQKDFKAGYTTINTNTISGTTNVYVISDGPAITLGQYSAFDKVVANAKIGQMTVYTSGKNVTDVVIDNRKGAAFSDDGDGSTTTEFVVKDVKYLDEKISSLTVIKNGAETTYSKFGTDASLKTKVNQGDVIAVKVLKDKETVSTVATDTTAVASHTNSIYGVATTAPGSFYMLGDGTPATNQKLDKYTLTADATIVKIANNTVSTITPSELKALALTNQVKVSLTVAGGDKADAVVVQTGAREDFLTVALAGLAAGRATTYGSTGVAVPGTAGDITTTNLYGAYTAAAADLKVIQNDIADAGLTATKWTGQPNGATILTNIENEIKRAAAYQIVSINAMTGTKQATITATGQGALDALKAALPSSIHATMADGTEKDIAVNFSVVADATYNSGTNVALTAASAAPATASLYWVATAANISAAGAITSCVVTPVAGTDTTTYVISPSAVADTVTLS